MSLTHRLFSDAFQDMQRAMSALEQPLFNTNRFSNNTGSMLRYPATDICETEEGYELHAELPGYDKKDINIELADGGRTLILSGTVKKVREEKSEEKQPKNDEEKQVTKRDSNSPQWWVNERVMGSFTRSFSFPNPLNEESIKATYENGILKIVVPKVDEVKPKQIRIQ